MLAYGPTEQQQHEQQQQQQTPFCSQEGDGSFRLCVDSPFLPAVSCMALCIPLPWCCTSVPAGCKERSWSSEGERKLLGSGNGRAAAGQRTGTSIGVVDVV